MHCTALRQSRDTPHDSYIIHSNSKINSNSTIHVIILVVSLFETMILFLEILQKERAVGT